MTNITILRPKDVAKVLCCSVPYAYELMRRSDFPSFKLGMTDRSGVGVRLEKLAEWIESREKKESA